MSAPHVVRTTARGTAKVVAANGGERRVLRDALLLHHTISDSQR